MQSELAEAMRETVSLRTDLETSLDAEQRLHEYLHSGTLGAAEFDHVHRFGSLHRQRIQAARVQLIMHEKAVERIRERLASARQRREALDQLREKAQAEHRREILAIEARELDEVGGQRAAAIARARDHALAQARLRELRMGAPA